MDIDCRWRGGTAKQALRSGRVRLGALRRAGARGLSVACLASLVACGGGDGGSAGGQTSEPGCSVREQQDWLAGYMDEWYFWYRLSPRPDAATYADVAGYFDALLYTGGDPSFPADRWSGRESTASFTRFYADGENLGYGVSVAGLEVVGQAAQPLYVRGVDPGSPAAAAGLRRGDRVLSLNGRSAADIIGADDFSALTASETGQVLNLRVERGQAVLELRLVAAVYAITPVTDSQVYTSPAGRRVGYLAVKNMISQAVAPIDQAFASFKAQQVQDLVLDLRYNGGGLVSVGGTLASRVASLSSAGNTYATLLYNDRRGPINNQTFRFENPANSLSLSRVFVLTGPRTCSASEQVINGLRGVGVQVLSIGDTTCGKPVGFLPAERCGQTYSVVNFESVNARNEGRYWDGFDASCPVSENWQVAQGAAADPLLAAASQLADGDSCPASAQGGPFAGRKNALGARRLGRALRLDERSEMLTR